MLLRDETPSDLKAIHRVNAAAFGQEDEANLVDALRGGGYVRLSLVAECESQIVGHILFTEMAIVTGAPSVPALSLAPLAVLPEFQRQGIGAALVRRGLELARQQGHRIVIVLGHEHYYPRFGFSSQLAQPIDSPFVGPSWMAVELVPGALAGIAGRARYAPPFGLE
jgi:putative acetyltransferase